MSRIFRVRTLQKCVRSSLGIISPLFLIFVLAHSSSGQTMVVIPSCGEAGKTKVCVTGSGWAEPAPPCFYRFFFNGNQVVFPDQPDGLFGPPKRSFIVPAGTAPGSYPVKVELRITSNNQLLQKKESGDLFFDFTFPFVHTIPFFKVVSAIKQPWTAPTPAGGTMNFTFDPTDVCDVTPCKKLIFIQVKEPIGVKADGTTRPLTHAEQGFANAATLDADLINGRSVDYVFGEKDPYYNGDDSGDFGQQGKQNGSPVASSSNDTPNRTDGAYPPDIVKIMLKFEVAAFCAEGDNAGEFVGKLLWNWERAKGAAGTSGTISGVAFSRDQPTQGFKDAANKWNTNHGFTAKFPNAKPNPCP